MEITPIAKIENGFVSKFGIPRQSGLSSALSRIIFEPPYRDPSALRGIEGFSHLWLIWQFSESVRSGFSPTVRPPRLGGNRRVGVFASRSPFRPNSLGLTCVRLVGIEHTSSEGDVLIVSGADLMNGTPIFDVKPYIAYADSYPSAICGFADETAHFALDVFIPPEQLQKIDPEDREDIAALLRNDPRPSYQHDPERIYYFEYKDYRISFRADEKKLSVVAIERMREEGDNHN